MVLLTVSVTLRWEECHNVFGDLVADHLLLSVTQLVQHLQVLLVGVRHDVFVDDLAEHPAPLQATAVDHVAHLHVLLLDVHAVSFREREVAAHEWCKIDTEFKNIDIILLPKVQALQRRRLVLYVIIVLNDGITFNLQQDVVFGLHLDNTCQLVFVVPLSY